MHSEAVTALRDCSIAVFSKRSFANAVCIAKRICGFEGTYLLHGPVAKLVIAPPCHGGGRRFESDLGRFGILAQLGEHLPYKQGVTGSSPVGPI